MRSLMATELMRLCVQEDNEEFPSVPPGFESYTSFSLKRVEDNNKPHDKIMTSCSASTSASESRSTQVETEVQVSGTAKLPRSLRRRPGINYGLYDNSSEEDTDSERHGQNFSSRQCLPKGVIRGCPDCSNCQKVVARWQPEDSCKPNVEDAPVFHPTEEEFQDTLKYIASIRSKAEPYGICRIVPPRSWKPPCPLKEKSTWEGSKFATRVQRIDKLQNRDSMRKISRIHNNMKRKKRRCTRMGMDNGTSGGPNSGFCESERFGFEPGPEFTLETFQRYADDFKARYFEKTENISHLGGNTIMFKSTWEPSVENIEGEYWRMVERPTEEIEVLYGADLETGVFGSGFPRNCGEAESSLHEQYIKSGWNLNNFARLPGSVLSYESSDISGVLVPWLYIGMCFSSFCWHVEDHHLYSLNYMHWGAPKLWYGVPGKDACRLEEAMRKHLPDLFEEQPDLLHKLVTQLSPSILKSEGVPVYRCVQNEGDFVLTFPRAYHSGFNCGFNCAEAVNVAPVDWLPHGQIAIELYREQRRKTSISHDKLLLGASREAVQAHWELDFLKKNTADNLRWKDVCGKDGVLAKAFKTRVEMERVRREFPCSSSQALKMESTFDAASERECSICFFDLHLSAAGCHCSPDRYACLDHAKQLCSCVWDSKFFLFRYDISELNILADALEGKQSAVYRWAKLDLGLALTSYVSNIEVSNLSHSSRERILQELRFQSSKLSHCSQDTMPKEMALPSSTVCIEDSHLVDVPIESLAKLGKSSYQSYLQQRKISKGVSSSSHTNNLLISNSSTTLSEIANQKNHAKKEEPVACDLNLRNPGCQRSQEHISCTLSLSLAEHGAKETSLQEHGSIILLSDDEGDESKMPDSDSGKELSKRLTGSHDKASPCNIKENSDLTIPITDAAVMGEKDNTASPHKDIGSYSTHPFHVNQEHHVSRGPVPGTTPVDLSCHIGLTSAGSVANIQAPSTGDTRDHHLESNSQHSVLMKPKNENNPEKFGGYATSNIADNVRSINESPSCSSSNLERRYRHKGPRIAKVVRRINCNVEPLEYGAVLSGKSWCNSQAIFPKGFRSRVRYISIIDPTSMCYYVSEILDAGRDEPLFLVSLEHCPSEVFIHISAARCWELVRDRVNQEITKQHKLGRMNLPPLQPPGSLDGFEMFGFSSPAIVQAIEALDQTRVCNEYWDSRPYSRPHGQIPQASKPNETGGKLHRLSSEEPNVMRNGLLPVEVDATLRRLFKKANIEELDTLYRIISNNGSVADRSLAAQLLDDEIHNRPI